MGEGTKNTYLSWNVSAEKIKDAGENKMGSVDLLVKYLEMQLQAWMGELLNRLQLLFCVFLLKLYLLKLWSSLLHAFLVLNRNLLYSHPFLICIVVFE